MAKTKAKPEAASGVPVLELEKFLAKKPELFVFLATGGETFFIDETRRIVSDYFLGAGDAGKCEIVIDHSEKGAKNFDKELYTLSMFTPRKLVVLNAKGSFLVEQKKKIVDFAGSGSTRAGLLIVSEDLKSNTNVYKAVLEHGLVIDAGPLKKHAVKDFVVGRFEKLGKKCSPQVAQIIVDICGQSLTRLIGEVEKTVLYVKDRQQIVREDVEALTIRTFEGKIWDVLDAVSERNPRKALDHLAKMLLQDASGAPFMFINMLASQIARLWNIKSELAKRAGPDEIAMNLGMSGFIVQKALPHAKRMSFPELREKSRIVLEAERLAKTSSLAETELILETLMVKLSS
ncbi:MAG: DNA polymerase III subunit delta [Planctomycetes bacterium]|nr:DNA polymerase III subunit delta [Planctomycetota bacterium]